MNKLWDCLPVGKEVEDMLLSSDNDVLTCEHCEKETDLILSEVLETLSATCKLCGTYHRFDPINFIYYIP